MQMIRKLESGQPTPPQKKREKSKQRSGLRPMRSISNKQINVSLNLNLNLNQMNCSINNKNLSK
jgi:hypothetical protein